MSERELAEAIYAEIIAAHSVAEARLTWAESEDMRYTLAHVACDAIETVLARRQREIARTGPWDPRAAAEQWVREQEAGPQKEDGYPGSLVPPRGKP